MEQHTAKAHSAPLDASILDATFQLASDGKVTDASAALVQLLGYPSAADSVHLSDLMVDPSEAKQVMAWLGAVLGCCTLQSKTHLYGKNGNKVPVDLVVSAVHNAGRVTGYCACKRRQASVRASVVQDAGGDPSNRADWYDMDELVRARSQISQLLASQEATLLELRSKQLALTESEFRLKCAIGVSREAVWDWNVAADETVFSPRWKEVFGYADEDTTPSQAQWKARIHPQDVGRASAEVKRLLGGNDPTYSVEFRAQCKDGNYIWVASQGLVVSRDSTGRPLRVIGTHKNMDRQVKARLRLEQSESRLRAITESTRTVMFLKDLDGRYLYANHAFEVVFHLSSDQYLGKSDLELFPNDVAQAVRKNDQWVIATGSTLEVEEDVPHDDGMHTYLSVKVPVHDLQGNVYAVCGMATDITERKHMEKEVRIAAVAFDSPISIIVTDGHQIIQRVNKAFEESTGFSAEFAVGRTPSFLRTGKHDDAVYANMWKSIQETGNWQGEMWGQRRNKELYLKWMSISAVRDEAGQISHYVGSESDISERKRAESALLQMNQVLQEKKAQLRELVAKNEATRESERKHIAREVHDELGQVLTALRMDTSFIAMRFGNLDPSLNAKVLGMRALVDNAIKGVRNVASNLRPMALDMGIYLALEWLCQDFNKRTGVACKLDSNEKDVVLDESRSIVVFRIVQESLTNISRYAQASQVFVTLGLSENALGVEIQDDGQGFDAVAVEAKKTFGLLGMMERALTLGGRLDVVSTPGKGTTIGLTIPFERRTDGGAR